MFLLELSSAFSAESDLLVGCLLSLHAKVVNLPADGLAGFFLLSSDDAI